MKKVFIARGNLRSNDAWIKPGRDFETILREAGFKNIGLPALRFRHLTFCKIWEKLSYFVAALRIKPNQLIAIQYPEPSHISKKIYDRIIRKRIDSFTLIHDINYLRGGSEFCFDFLRNTKVIIAHTPAMARWIEDNIKKDGCPTEQIKTIELGVFPYHTDFRPDGINSVTWSKPYSIVFAGNLSKSKFLEALDLPPEIIRLKLFGHSLTPEMKRRKCIDYMGVTTPEELLGKISGYDFGLVWDGDSQDLCTGKTGEYLKYNCPYKLASYLAAGLPVIVWDKMAMASFIKEHKAGICVSSLNDIPSILEKMTAGQYMEMKKSALRLGERVRDGYYYRKALESALSRFVGIEAGQ